MADCPNCGGDHPVTECPSAGTSWDAPTELGMKPVPQALGSGLMVGEYRLTKRLGEGGMGVVWEGVHPLIGRKVAVKLVEETSAPAAARFLKEAQAASRLRHRNIVDVFGFGTLPDGRSYLVMELLSGESFADRLEKAGAISFEETLHVADGILLGLRAAHEQGIIHRDLKPDNVWLSKPDVEGGPSTVKLLDFGLAKMTAPSDAKDSLQTRAGTPLGTPAFMSPEQCRGIATIDHRTDLYAVGVMLYQALSGRLPFSADTFMDVMAMHLSADPPSLAALVGMPAQLEALIRKAIAKLPDDRWASAEELRQALHAAGQAGARGWSARVGMTAAPDMRTMVPPQPVVALSNNSKAVGLDAPPSVMVSKSMIQHAPAPSPQPQQRENRATTDEQPSRFQAPLEESVLLENLTVAPTVEGALLTLSFQGELDSETGAMELGDYLSAVTSAMQGNIRRVVLDLEGVHYLDGNVLSCLSDWLGALAGLRADGLAPTTIRYTTTVSWQRATIPSLTRIDPALMLEASDW